MANLIGIEIDAFSVRGAVVKTQFRRAQVMRYIEVPLASFEDAALLDAAPASDGTSRAVKELLRQAGAGADTIASLSAADVSLRRIELPIAAAKKVDELLPFEVESLIPFEAEETLLDYQTIEGDASKLRMLVCAAPKDRITERLRVLDEDGLDPVSLIPSAPALAGLTAFIPALANGTQMKPVLRAVFLSSQFMGAGYFQRYAWPAEFVVRSLKEVGYLGFSVNDALTPMVNMGQTLYEPPDVAGWDLGTWWFSTGGMLARMNFASVLASNQKFALRDAARPYGATPESLISNFALSRLTMKMPDQPVYDALLTYVRAGGTWTGSDTQLTNKAGGVVHLLAGSADYQFV